MSDQNYNNHSRYVPLFHFGVYAGIAILMGCGVYKLIRNYQLGLGGIMVPALLILVSLILTGLAWYSRLFALRAQDRAIRAEENLRHFVLTGKLLDRKLRIGQIVALRFASDHEFVDLAAKAAAQNLSSKDIKRSIKDWRADHHRV